MSNVVFHGAEHYFRRKGSYELMPFRFMDLDGRRILVNEVGEYLFLDEAKFKALMAKTLSPNDPTYQDLKSKHFLVDSGAEVPLRLLATKYRTKRSFLAGFTRLHILVVSLRCDHSCHYCQVSRVSPDRLKYDMTSETAMRALDLIFRSPANEIKIEFQGGEPLLNVELIQFVVHEVRRRNVSAKKEIQFVVTTNLAFINDDILRFLNENSILVSTSLDGPAFIHNANRPRPGNDSYELTVAGIKRVRETLGPESISAIMTTTRLSLQHPRAIIDEYIAQGFDAIFLRPISPYGFALKTKTRTGYEVGSFLEFYKEALDYIIELNSRGQFFVESYAQLLLKKILTPFATGYVDLQSPAGAGIGVAVYNYDGDVYPTDEARMLVEMGDPIFKLGNVHENSYEEIFGGETLRSMITASCVESLPGCAECALQTYCGSDPVENYATQGTMFGHRPTSGFHKRNYEIIRHLLRLYHGSGPLVQKIFWSWVQNRPIRELLLGRAEEG